MTGFIFTLEFLFLQVCLAQLEESSGLDNETISLEDTAVVVLLHNSSQTLINFTFDETNENNANYSGFPNENRTGFAGISVEEEKLRRATSPSSVLKLSKYNTRHKEMDPLYSAQSRPTADGYTPRNMAEKWRLALSATYDKDQRPNSTEPTDIHVSMAIIRVHSVSEVSMSYGIDTYFRESWLDERLRYDPADFGNQNVLDMPLESVKLIWLPDTYFPNAISNSGEDGIPNRLHVQLFSNGSVWYSRRLQLIADCPMNLMFYPFDVQACQLVIASYQHIASDVRYKWIIENPVTIAKTVRLPEFNIKSQLQRAITEQWPKGMYSLLQTCLVFKRNAGFCLLQLVIPAAAVVTSSWVSLWLEEETQFSDIIAVILAIIFLSYAQNSVMPRVSYVKLIDVYLIACFAFTFVSLAKLVILKYIEKRWKQKNRDALTTFHEEMISTSLKQLTGVKNKGQTKKPIINAQSELTDIPENENDDMADAALRQGVRNSIAVMQNDALLENQMMEDHLMHNKPNKVVAGVKCCHILTQLFLPILFVLMILVCMILLPNVNQGSSCW